MKPIESADSPSPRSPYAAERPATASLTRSELRRLGVTEIAHGSARSVPSELTVGGRSVRLDGWERMVLRAYGLGPDADGRPWPSLAAHAIAFRLRSADFDDDVAQHTPEQRARVVASARSNSALAEDLLRELEWTRRRLTGEGQTRLATRFTELIDRVDRNAASTRELLGDASPERTNGEGSSSFDRGYRERWPETRSMYDRAAASGLAVPAPSPPAARRRYAIRLRFGASSILLIALGVALVAAIALFAPVGSPRAVPTAAGLGPVFQLPAVVDASAMSGLATVTIDPEAWSRLPENRRTAELARIAEIARDAGHRRLEVRTTDGKLLVSN